MSSVDLRAFFDEVEKIKMARSVTDLLASSARRKGIRPSTVPAINQAGNAAKSGNRQRAAEIARSVRGHLSQTAAQPAARVG